MYVVSEESGFDATEHGVQDDTNRKEKTSGWGWHPSQRGNNCTSTGEKHCSDEDIRHESESHEDQMGYNTTGLLLTVACNPTFRRGATYYRARMTSRNVCAFGAFFLSSIATVANRRICTVAPLAYQKGPETP